MQASRLDTNLQAFDEQVSRARSVLRASPHAAAVHAQIAGDLAWLNHTGLFAFAPLEMLLRGLGRDCVTRTRNATWGGGRRGHGRRVLHVLTTAYPTGGHTRMVARWIEQDTRSGHDVVITRQQGRAVPSLLAEAVAARGGQLVVLDTGRDTLLQLASRLRGLAADADAVLVSAHPHDVVPVLAAADGSAPCIYINHADHVFWLGTGAASLLLSLRESGRRLSVERRGIGGERGAVLARPLGTVARRVMPREEAKRRLGVEPSTVVLFTAAAASKYEAIDPPAFLDLVLPVLERHPSAVLVAAGPSDEGAWAVARDRSGGRVRALGRRLAMPELHAAADIYLDSYPFSSLTSLTEAGCCGVPLVAFRGHPEEAAVLGADSPGLDGAVIQASDPAAFVRELGRLIADGEARKTLGARTRQAILDTHVGSSWQAGCEGVYARATALPHLPAIGDTSRETGTLDVLVALLQERTGWADGLAGSLRDHGALLPWRQRVGAWAGGAGDTSRPPARMLLPEWVMTGVRARRTRRRAG